MIIERNPSFIVSLYAAQTKRSRRCGNERTCNLYALVLTLTISGLVLAAAALAPLRAVTDLAPTTALKRAWTWLTYAILFCFVARTAAAIGRLTADVGSSDVFDALVHVIGPCVVLGLAWLSLNTSRQLIRLGPYERLAFEDPLTRLGNRRAFDAQLAAEMAESGDRESPVLLVLGDVDAFKQVNDRLGHDAGDRVLTAVARAIGGHQWRSRAFRLGGDEFAIVVPGLGPDHAKDVTEDLQRAVEIASSQWGTSQEGFSVSFGAAASKLNDTPETLFRRADQALYEAKRAGQDAGIAA